MSNTIENMKRIYDEALNLAERKNADYGDAWRTNGWRGNLSRVFEKDHRLRTLLWNGENPGPAVNEGVRETAIDMLNTLTFFIMNLDAGVEWGHETPFDNVGADWNMGLGTVVRYDQSSGILPETAEFLQDQIQSAALTGVIPVQEEPAELQLPVRVPGEELNPNNHVYAGEVEPEAPAPRKPRPRRT